MILTILQAYGEKELKIYDDDDGIGGEETAVRHLVFDNVLAGIGTVRNGTLNKDAVVRTFRALADFYETED